MSSRFFLKGVEKGRLKGKGLLLKCGKMEKENVYWKNARHATKQ